jgi:hypothetical protein
MDADQYPSKYEYPRKHSNPYADTYANKHPNADSYAHHDADY